MISAMGTAWVGLNIGMTPEQVIRYAVSAAIALNNDCNGEPFIHLLSAN